MKAKRRGCMSYHSCSLRACLASLCRKGLPGGVGLLCVCVFLLFGTATVFAAPVQKSQFHTARHALLVSSQPAADAILQAPPTSVRMWFSETLIPPTSTALVVDTTNHQVDLKNSHVNENNGAEMDLSLPLLPAGTYVVVWQTQSAIDGHVARGSFLFRIARPDGSIPPIPAVLPTGHIPGAAGVGIQSSNTLDGPTLLQTISTWIALLLLTFWLGSVIWETWIFAPDEQRSFAYPSMIEQASKRRRTYTCYALVGILIADSGLIFGQAAELAGNWSGSISVPLLHAILFESHFGIFWWIREGVALLALLFLLMMRRRAVPMNQRQRAEKQDVERQIDVSFEQVQEGILRGEAAFVSVLRGIPHLPGYLIDGFRKRSWDGRIECLLGFALIFAFELSGHAAAVTSSALWAIIGIDLLHLLANAAWVGGLLYIGLVLLPTLDAQPAQDWADVLAFGLPRFSVVALTSVIFLAVTGSLNTTVHLTSLQQFWTTTYGRVLLVKIGIFLLMMGISAYHAFFLRPRLTEELAVPMLEQETVSAPEMTRDTHAMPSQQEPASTHAIALSPLARHLGKRLEYWLRLEGTLGAGILLCVALLSAFAGSLTPATNAASTSAQPTGPVTETKVVDGYSITLHIDPATFGTNTFLVVVKDTQGHAETGAAVLIDTTMLDMDMGTDEIQLHPESKQPGTYSVQGDLTMAGHWQIGVRVLPATSNTFVKATFDFSAA